MSVARRIGGSVESRVPLAHRTTLLRIEAFDILDHANVLGARRRLRRHWRRARTFGQTSPGLADIDPPRTVQLQARFRF